GITYDHGLVGAVICSMYGLAAFLAGRFFAGRWRRTALPAATDFINIRFGRRILNFYTIYRGGYLCINGLSLYALAVMLCPLIPLAEGNLLRDEATGMLSVDWACIILAAIVIGYTTLGGLWAVLITDMLQFIVLTLCVVAVVPLIIVKAGGVMTVVHNAPDGFFQPTAPGFSAIFLVGWLLINLFNLGAEWTYVQRHLCVPTPRDAQKSMYLFGALYLTTPFLWMAPPFVFRTIQSGIDPQEAYILACKSVLPAGMIGMMIAAMFSATASSLSSSLNMYAGALTDGLYKRYIRPDASDAQSVFIGRWFTFLIGVYLLAGALVFPRLGEYRDVLISVLSLSLASLLLPTVWALYSPKVGSRTVLWTLLVGIPIIVVYKFAFSETGWLAGNRFLYNLNHFVSAHRRESDLIVGIVVPLAILLISELRRGGADSGWIQSKERIAEFQKRDTQDRADEQLPLKVFAWSLGLLGTVVAGLTILANEQVITLASISFILLASCLFLVALLRKRAT
ncbi:MAG: Na+:solute symporter, partial [Verrucomicrobiae bacterium]|nr:Na+:solute symporter [Verrucomicrobiae bacterium]